ncbi:MAG: cell division FtsK/SpoIIIE [Parcubacteria group bacterium GW2011_GWA1_60_11]|nr:MAG: cell division FtsK/SpoIIIE [Parcubacteria group bacterium GW2011_GWA1_60_11]
MAKKNRSKKKKELSKSRLPSEAAAKEGLHPDIKKSVLAIAFLGLAVIFVLASFGNAGPAGSLLYLIFDRLFGIGYYLLPLTSLALAGVFLFSEERRFYGVTLLGAAFFVAAGLGLIDVIGPERAGWTGSAIGSIETLFGYTASIVILGTLLVASAIVMLNAPLRFRWPRQEDEESTEQEEMEIAVTLPEAPPVLAEAPNPPKADGGKEEEKSEEASKTPRSAHATARAQSISQKFKNYVAPPLSLLKSSVEKPTPGDLRANANIIKRTLESFGIPVEMGEINIGPKVTRYTLKPAEGVKLSRITALNQDLSLALAAHPIRIEAPIPGKSLVGIEVPNKSAAVVRLGSLMAYSEFHSAASTLTFVLGRDVSGEPIFADITKMPHMLIAGATGSGKSVAIHSLIVSLLYKNSPETLRLAMIDPKRVELSIYRDIPHLIAPVVTEGKKALSVFRWAISEMERRYELLQHAGARDIKSYNHGMKKEPLPYIVIVIDELADLMAAYGRDVEGAVVRLAQMARATGIHLVMSTQRPSVEVITGLIKANITARVALQVASQVDSRTILDTGGAEKLLGGGDMLFVSSEFSKPKRIQGAYISEEEIHTVADFIREHNKDISSDEEISFGNGAPGSPGAAAGTNLFENFSPGEDDEDDMYEEAVRVVREAQKASASLLQRRLKLGYARAARLLDIMEERGIVGPGDGAKPREVFVGNNEEPS